MTEDKTKGMSRGLKVGIFSCLGCGGFVIVGFIIMLAAGLTMNPEGLSPNNPGQLPSMQASQKKAGKIGEDIVVGYTQYNVQSVAWKKRLGSQYVGATADGKYLLVNLTVGNLDKEPRMVPGFKLIGDNGYEYTESADSVYLGDKHFMLTTLNPGISKKGTLVFDVPEGNRYQLELSGGYWSSDSAMVRLN